MKVLYSFKEILPNMARVFMLVLLLGLVLSPSPGAVDGSINLAFIVRIAF